MLLLHLWVHQRVAVDLASGGVHQTRTLGDGQAGQRIAQAIDDYFEGHAHG